MIILSNTAKQKDGRFIESLSHFSFLFFIFFKTNNSQLFLIECKVAFRNRSICSQNNLRIVAQHPLFHTFFAIGSYIMPEIGFVSTMQTHTCQFIPSFLGSTNQHSRPTASTYSIPGRDTSPLRFLHRFPQHSTHKTP